MKNFNGFTHLLTMLYAVIMRFDSLREIEAAMTAEVRKEREARLAAEKQDRYHNILNRFIAEGRAALRAFALTTRTNFNDKEATSIYYGIMAVACKMELSLGTNLYPWYCFKCFYSSKHVRGFFKIIVWSICLISICLTCIIANDNVKLHTIQKKYVLLREFARLNQEWADKADYIEFLYTDEAEHQKDIERLWENRHKRLAK